MKTRESDMPDGQAWSGFFDADLALQKFGLMAGASDVVDFGCGYGTFTLPAARLVAGTVHALDIDPVMIKATCAKAEAAGLTNVKVYERDFMAAGTGLPKASAGYAMLFNILHCEQPLALLSEAWQVLKPGGVLGVMHWNPDPSTPRGPSMNIRPTPGQCRMWAMEVGFACDDPWPVDLQPYHFGLVLRKPEQ